MTELNNVDDGTVVEIDGELTERLERFIKAGFIKLDLFHVRDPDGDYYLNQNKFEEVLVELKIHEQVY